jgi:MFS family permease
VVAKAWTEWTKPRAGGPPATGGNEALISWTGLLLIPLLGLVGLTGVAFGTLWRAHFIVGILLIPVLGLKLMATTYRAVRYYTGSKKYRAAGPPEWTARIMALPLIAVTIVAMTSGVVMWLANNQDRPWSTIHTDSVVIMGGLVGLHVLIYLPKAMWAAIRDLDQLRRHRRPAALRISLVVTALIVGTAVGFMWRSNASFPVRHHDRIDVTSFDR